MKLPIPQNALSVPQHRQNFLQGSSKNIVGVWYVSCGGNILTFASVSKSLRYGLICAQILHNGISLSETFVIKPARTIRSTCSYTRHPILWYVPPVNSYSPPFLSLPRALQELVRVPSCPDWTDSCMCYQRHPPQWPSRDQSGATAPSPTFSLPSCASSSSTSSSAMMAPSRIFLTHRANCSKAKKPLPISFHPLPSPFENLRNSTQANSLLRHQSCTIR